MGDERLRGEILAVLAEAKFGLTEDEILAVITIRREREVFAVLEAMILDGELGAMREGPLDRVAMSGDFSFWRLTDDEAGRRPTDHGTDAAHAGSTDVSAAELVMARDGSEQLARPPSNRPV